MTTSETSDPSPGVGADAPSRIGIWVDAARPKTLLAGACPVVVGTALAISDGRAHLLSASVALLGALALQIAANFANDYFDHVQGADTEDRVGPTRAVQAGLVTQNAMLYATGLALAFATLAGLYLASRGGWPIIAIGIAAIFCSVGYTAGHQIPRLSGIGRGLCHHLLRVGCGRWHLLRPGRRSAWLRSRSGNRSWTPRHLDSGCKQHS